MTSHISYAIHHKELVLRSFKFTIKSSFCTLLPHFEPLYMNMYLIGLSDGAVSHYALRFEIYRATSVFWSKYLKFSINNGGKKLFFRKISACIKLSALFLEWESACFRGKYAHVFFKKKVYIFDLIARQNYRSFQFPKSKAVCTWLDLRAIWTLYNFCIMTAKTLS